MISFDHLKYFFNKMYIWYHQKMKSVEIPISSFRFYLYNVISNLCTPRFIVVLNIHMICSKYTTYNQCILCIINH